MILFNRHVGSDSATWALKASRSTSNLSRLVIKQWKIFSKNIMRSPTDLVCVRRYSFNSAYYRAKKSMTHKLWQLMKYLNRRYDNWGGHLGGTQYRNTVRKNGKYRNTAWKIVQIPIPHFLSHLWSVLHTYGCCHLACLKTRYMELDKIISGIYAPDVHVSFLMFW